MMNGPRGAGLEALFRIARRNGQATEGRRRNLLRSGLQPGRCAMHAASSALERWREQALGYDRVKNDNGQRFALGRPVRRGEMSRVRRAGLSHGHACVEIQHVRGGSGRITFVRCGARWRGG